MNEKDTPKAQRLREDFRNAIHELIAPDFFPYELANALTKAERQTIINPPNGWGLWMTVMAACPVLIQPLHLMPRAYAISSRYRSALFDCLYIALAEQEQCEFITADEKLLKNIQPHFPLVRALSSMP